MNILYLSPFLMIIDKDFCEVSKSYQYKSQKVS